MSSPKPDTRAAVEFLQHWSAEGPWVLTSIVPALDKKTTTRTFGPSETKEMSEWIERRQGKENLYFHVNPVRRALSSKASKEDMARLAWLHVDIDPRAGEDFTSERVRALKLLQNAKPAPTVITDSGGGFQGFWKLKDSPELAINGQVTRAQELEAYNIQLERIFGADHCHNVDRIMRIPGTINVPDEKKQKKGRVPALASLIVWNEAAEYELTEFTPAVRVQNKEPGLSGGQPKVKITGNVPVVGVEELRAWAKEHGKIISDHTLAVIATGADPIDPAKYPSRSEALFAVCCALVRADVPEEMIYAVITGPNEIASSVREKRGWESYALRQIERAKEEAIDPWLRRLNEKHAVIGDIGGKCRIISEVMDSGLGRSRISKQTFEDFRNRYRNLKVQVGTTPKGQPITIPLGNFWIDHPQRRQYEQIIFAPNREVEDAYNLWRGFTCDALPGKRHEKFLAHLRDNICSGVEENYRYLIGWIARMFQKPDSPGEVAVVLRGQRGTGKSFFMKQLGLLFGRHFLQVADSKHLVGSFNAHLRDAVFVFGDEAFFAGDKRHEGVLKTLITEESIVIEGKGLDAESAPNFCHLGLASNDDWVVPAGLDERRFFVLDVGSGSRMNFSYFAEMKKDLDEGGRENLLYFLLNYDLSAFEVRAVPQTKALQEQKMLSMSPDDQWLFEKVWEGRLLHRHDTWQPKVLKDQFYNDYIREMDARRINYRLGKSNFTRFLARHFPAGEFAPKQEMADVPVVSEAGGEFVERKRAYVFYLPTLKKVRDFWDRNLGGPYEWPAVENDQEPLSVSHDKSTPF